MPVVTSLVTTKANNCTNVGDSLKRRQTSPDTTAAKPPRDGLLLTGQSHYERGRDASAAATSAASARSSICSNIDSASVHEFRAAAKSPAAERACPRCLRVVAWPAS